MGSILANGGWIGQAGTFSTGGVFGLRAHGRLLAAVIPPQPLGLSSALLTLSGANGSWVQRTIDVSAYALHQVRIVFEWAMTDNFLNDAQIDLVALDGKSYDFESSPDSWETTINHSSAAYGSASFSAVGTGAGDGEWKRDENGTPSTGTGRDDAASGDWYLYYEASNPDQDIRGFLRSPTISLDASPGNLTFYEARDGCQSGSNLIVYIDVVAQP